LKAHPAARLIPRPTDEEREALRADIEANGLLEPIETFNNAIIDGITREEICRQLGIAAKYKDVTKAVERVGPYTYILSKSTRRNLTEDQWEGIVTRARDPIEKEARARQGKRTDLQQDAQNLVVEPPQGLKTRDILADMAPVPLSPREVGRAIRVDKADPKLLDRVIAGDIKVSAAEQVITGKADLVTAPDGKVKVVKREEKTPKPDVLTSVQSLYRLTQGTPKKQATAWDGDWKRLAAEWASIRAYMESVFESRGQLIPQVIKGEIT
jgi:hypothetical protein